MSPQLPTRKRGKNGPKIVAEGFGLMGLSVFYGKPESDEQRFKVLDRALELGQTNWDSADMYADSEDLLGKWFKRTGKRDQIFLATKFGNKMLTGKGLLTALQNMQSKHVTRV
jgi:aryl-alcohol dehydrogenase-like predicted oxidoreductase